MFSSDAPCITAKEVCASRALKRDRPGIVDLLNDGNFENVHAWNLDAQVGTSLFSESPERPERMNPFPTRPPASGTGQELRRALQPTSPVHQATSVGAAPVPIEAAPSTVSAQHASPSAPEVIQEFPDVTTESLNQSVTVGDAPPPSGNEGICTLTSAPLFAVNPAVDQAAMSLNGDEAPRHPVDEAVPSSPTAVHIQDDFPMCDISREASPEREPPREATSITPSISEDTTHVQDSRLSPPPSPLLTTEALSTTPPPSPTTTPQQALQTHSSGSASPDPYVPIAPPVLVSSTVADVTTPDRAGSLESATLVNSPPTTCSSISSTSSKRKHTEESADTAMPNVDPCAVEETQSLKNKRQRIQAPDPNREELSAQPLPLSNTVNSGSKAPQQSQYTRSGRVKRINPKRANKDMPAIIPSDISNFCPMPEAGRNAQWPIPIYNWFYQLDTLSPRWGSLVNSWLHLEELDEFGGSQRLGGKRGGEYRPAVIGDWIQAGRTIDFKPQKFPPLREYEKTYWQWWRGLQHESRKVDELEDGEVIYLRQVPPPEGVQKPWRRVDVTGCNGLTSVLAGLCMWGLQIALLPSQDFRQRETRDENMHRWLRAIDDVRFAIDGILASRGSK
jgi:hypothetical protein